MSKTTARRIASLEAGLDHSALSLLRLFYDADNRLTLADALDLRENPEAPGAFARRTALREAACNDLETRLVSTHGETTLRRAMARVDRRIAEAITRKMTTGGDLSPDEALAAGGPIDRLYDVLTQDELDGVHVAPNDTDLLRRLAIAHGYAL